MPNITSKKPPKKWMADWMKPFARTIDAANKYVVSSTLDRLELSRFLAPPVVADHRNAPVNAFGYLRIMFTVHDIDDSLARLGKRGAELVGDVVQYEDMYRLCYIRGPEGILIGLAQELGRQSSR